MSRRNVFVSLGVAALAAMVLVPMAALSHGPGPGGPDGEGRGRGFDRGARMAEKLGLDDAQKKKVEAIFEEHRDEASSLREQVEAKREQVKQLWLAKAPNRQAILAVEAEVNALHGQLAAERVDFMFKVKGVLTAEQFGKFVELQAKHGKGFRGMHGKRGEGRGQRGEGGWGGKRDGRGGAAPQAPTR